MATEAFTKNSLDSTDFVRERRELNASLLRVVSPLKCRPSPRDAWDKVARDDYQIRNLHAVVPMVRQALSTASRLGADKLARVRTLASYHFRTLEHMALVGHLTRPDEPVQVQCATLLHVTGDAIASFAHWCADPKSRLCATRAAEALLSAIAELESAKDSVFAVINQENN